MRFDRVLKDRPLLRPQARKHEPEYLSRLAESLEKGQLQPIGLLKDMTVVFGNARVLAARMNPNITHLNAAIFDEPVTEREFQRMRFIENQVRQDLSNAEKCQNCVEYAKSEPNLPLKVIAADLGVDPSLVTRWMSWVRVVEPVRQALAADKIVLNEMYTISQLPEGEQEAALAEVMTNGVAGLRRKKNSNQVRLSRFKYPLPSGVEITVSGKELSISDLIEALSDLVKEAKRASDQGLDIKTLVAVAKDKARKG